MIAEFDVEMTVGKIYDYLLKHAFSTPQGLLGEIAGLTFLVLYFITNNLVLFCIGLLAMIYIPLTLYLNAKKQMEQVTAFANKIHYIVSQQGIAIVTNEKKQFQAWTQLYKVVSTSKSIIIYTDEVNACVLPKEDMGKDGKLVVKLITSYMPKNRVHLEKMDVNS